MAIFNDLPGVSVGITINDQLLPEHEFPEIDHTERTVDRLVEAKSNQVFEIRMTVDSSTDFKGSELAFRISVDGNHVDMPLVQQEVKNLDIFTETSLGHYVSPTQVRKYKFMNIEAVAYHSTSLTSRSSSMRHSMSGQEWSEANRLPALSKPALSENSLTPTMSYTPPKSASGLPVQYSERESSSLGTIKVKVSHVNKTHPVDFGPTSTPQAYIGTVGRQEAGQRNITQRVAFTAPENTSPVATWSKTNVPNVPNPAVTFIFHYRAQEAVKAILALSDTIKAESAIKKEPKIKKEPDNEAVDGIKSEPLVESRP